MAVNLYDSGNGDGLFDVLGKAFHAQATVLTAHAITVPAQVTDVFTQLANTTEDNDTERLAGQLATAAESHKSAGNSILTALQTFATGYLQKIVDDDADLRQVTEREALEELIEQMESNSDSLDASAVAETVTEGGSNQGGGKVVATVTDGLARTRVLSLAETISGRVLASGQVQFTSSNSEQPLSVDWPGGSGIRSNRSFAAPGGLLSNGGLDDEDDNTDVPDDWIVSTGTVGTTLKMTDLEIQTVVISGSPTGGFYNLKWSDGSYTYSTGPLAYNAGQSTVQTALRLIPGLANVTVGTTGTAPNYTHTITFNGQGGNVAQLTSDDFLTGGTPNIAHATTSAGSANVYSDGKALEFDSNGSETTTIQQSVTLQPETAYAVGLFMLADVVPAAGVITVDLVDGIGGTVIQDAAGNNNSFTIDCTGLTTSFQWIEDIAGSDPIFRTPAVLPPAIYFRIRISTAVSSGTSVFLDHVCLQAMSELYRGGPLVACFATDTDPVSDDTFDIAVTNDRAGLLHEWLDRNFDLRGKGLIFPVDAGGSETVPDTVVG